MPDHAAANIEGGGENTSQLCSRAGYDFQSQSGPVPELPRRQLDGPLFQKLPRARFEDTRQNCPACQTRCQTGDAHAIR
jgi:hypothetical protein